MDIMDEVIDSICKNAVNRKSILDNYQQIAVAIDEMIDNGLVFNTDSENIDQRLNMRDVQQSAAASSEGGYFKSVTLISYFFNLNIIFLDVSKSQKHSFPELAILSNFCLVCNK